MNIQIKKFQPGDEGIAYDIIKESFDASQAEDYTEEGNKEFHSYASEEGLRSRMDENYFGLMAYYEGRPAGVIEIRNNNHISLFFVRPGQERKGIGRELFKKALQICREGNPGLREMDVHASPYAVEAYKKLGFIAVGEEKEENGIRYVPMTLKVEPAGKKAPNRDRIARAVKEILLAIGEDPEREGLVETPDRVAAMYEEIFSGLYENPEDHMKMFTESKHDEMVTVRDIPLYSMCEHHLLPFIGTAHIAYIPRDGHIIGLSKLARVVDSFARRPQLQERLTAQLADFLQEQLNPQGVAVMIEAEHLCMTMRGARAAGSKTQTSALRGNMRSDARTRMELMSMLTGK